METIAVPLGGTHPVRQLYDYNARFYNPIWSRFQQRDPSGYPDGMNPYEYLKSNPFRYVDPKGTVVEEVMNYFWYQPGVYASNQEIQTVLSMGLDPSEAASSELRMLQNAGEALFGFTPTGMQLGYTVNPADVAAESGRIVGGVYTGAVEGTTQSLVNFKAAQLIAGRETNLVEEAAYGTLHNLGLLGLAEGPADIDLQSNTTLSDQPVDFLLFTGNERFRRTTEGVGMAAILLSGFAPQEAETSVIINAQRANLLRNLEASKAARAASKFDVHANFERAYNFYRSDGWSAQRTLDHIAGIDLTRPVEIVQLSAGTKVVQYQYPLRPVGNYFAPIGTPANILGIDPTGRLSGLFTTGSKISVLQSTAATIPDWMGSGKIFSGGGIQYFTPSTHFFTKVP